MSEGQVTINRAGDPPLVLSPAFVRAERITYDRQQFRAPYSSAWRTAGTRQRYPNRFTFTVEVQASSINQAAPIARGIVDAFGAADSITVPFGVITPTGVESYSVTPIGKGYRLTVTLMNATTSVTVHDVGPNNVVTANGDPVVAGGEHVVYV